MAFPPASPAFGASPPVSTRISALRLEGRDGWAIANDRLRIGVLSGGGFIGELSLTGPHRGAGINVMRVPHYQTIDPDTFNLARDGPLYGDGMQRKLMSGYMGHFTAFPHFGGSSPSEFAQDYAQHGETIAVRWKRSDNGADDVLAMAAELPLTHYRFGRSIALPPGQPLAYVTETATSQLAFDRPFQWVQHITFGAPFVEIATNLVDRSPARRVENRQSEAMMLGDRSDSSTQSFTGESQAWSLAGERPDVYLTICNPKLGILVGYVFDAAAHPWLLDWQEYHRNQAVPWLGQGVARGLCIGNSFTGGLQSAVRQGSLGGVPLYGWFDAMGTATRSYKVFAIPIEPDFQGVADLRSEAGAIALIERDTGRQIEINHRGPKGGGGDSGGERNWFETGQ